MISPVPEHFLAPPDRHRLERLLRESADERVGTRLGPFRLRECVAIGGMGTVYRAERDDGAYRQIVAVKVTHIGRPSPAMQAQLRRERQILAGLQHPDIARLLDAGETEDGRWWLAMEWIDGRPITEHCRRRGLNARQRVALLARVCRAVDAAHRALVVHRDLKPGNVLVTPEGEPRVIDFGISVVVSGASPAAEPEPDSERRSSVAGTPGYASPEQRRGDPVGTASDVWSLGVLLREMLEGAPHRPMPRDLRAIADRATAEQPAARLGTARELAEELERWRQGRAVESRGAAPLYRTGKLLRRRWLPIGLLVAFLGSQWWSAALARAEQHRAELAEEEAERRAEEARRQAERALTTRNFLRSLLAFGDQYRGGHLEFRVRDLLEVAARRLDRDLESDPLSRLYLHDTLAAAAYSLGDGVAAERHVRAALELAEGRDDVPLRQRVELRGSLGAALHAQYRLDEARVELEEALALGAGDADCRASRSDRLSNLGVIHMHDGDPQAAEPLLREALQLGRETGSDFGSSLALTQQNLAEVQRELGRHDEARALLRELLARRDELPDVTVAGLLNNLGSILHEQERLPEATEAWKEGFALLQAGQQEDHPHAAYLANNLALALEAAGELDEAESHYRAAIQGFARILGDAHPQLARVLRNLAALLARQGRVAEARELMLRAVAILERSPQSLPGETEQFRAELAMTQRIER